MQTVRPVPEKISVSLATTPGSAKVNLVEQLYSALFKPVDISFLVSFRILFGGIMLWEVSRYFSHGWVSRYFIEPAVNFTYHGFSWVKPWPGRGMYIHFIVLGIAAAFVMVGFLYRIAAPVFFLAFTYVFLLDQALYLNHFYLVCLISFLLCFLPAEREFSVDSALRRTIHSEKVPAWTLWLLRAQVGIPYFYGGIAKLNSDWIIGGEPMRSWLRPLGKAPALGHVFTSEWVIYSFVIAGLLIDLLVVPLLLWRRTRIIALVIAILFNLINAVIFDIGIFPWFMLGALLIYFPPDFTRRLAQAIWSAGREDQPQVRKTTASIQAPAFFAPRRLVAGLLVGYLAVQLLLPLRHYLYPGNVSWTEEGHNFAWHMKLRTKVGEATFTVTHPESGRSWTIIPKDYLKPHQVMKMIAKPDLVLQFAHFLANEKHREGYQNVEVRARVMVSLNGRDPQLLVDPNIDLTKEEMSLLPANWITPLTSPLKSRRIDNSGK